MTHQSHPLPAEDFPTTRCKGPRRTSGPESEEASGMVQSSECQGICSSAISWSKSPLSH